MQSYCLIEFGGGSTYSLAEPITIAEAQMAINEAITRRHLCPGAYLRVEADRLVINHNHPQRDPETDRALEQWVASPLRAVHRPF
jgi:hypothetical protein